MSIPEPPGFKHPNRNKIEPIVGPEKPTKTTVERDEITEIFSEVLLPQHATDPNVIRFISRYLICRNARQAAKEVGLQPTDGAHLLRRPDIYEAIRKITDRATMKHGYDAAEIVERVKEVVGVDPADFQDPTTGAIIENLHTLDPAIRRAIKKFKAKNEYGYDANGMQVVTGKIIEIEFWDKMTAATLLGREKDIFKDKKVVEHNVSNDMRSVLLEARKRAETFQIETIDVTPKETDNE